MQLNIRCSRASSQWESNSWPSKEGPSAIIHHMHTRTQNTGWRTPHRLRVQTHLRIGKYSAWENKRLKLLMRKWMGKWGRKTRKPVP